jgi:hypothetical protein
MISRTSIITIGMFVLATVAQGGVLDGQNIQADASMDGLTLLGVQDTQTGFGDSPGGQGSPGGSELDLLYAGLSGGNLNVSIAGNLEANFNKMWIFFDAVPGGENVLLNDNVDGGFGEINAMAGLTFDSGFEPDHAIRIEVGSGFLGIRYADLIDNVGGDISTSGGGPGDLPTGPVAGALGVNWGWDNGNALGVEGGTGLAANDPFTADTGWEFEISLLDFFADGGISQVGIATYISNGDGTFLSNQVLPGIGGGDNLGGGAGVNFNNIPGDQYAVIPEPMSLMLLGLGLVIVRRR